MTPDNRSTPDTEDDGRYEWRKEQYAEAAEQLGENTKSKGIDAATAFTIEMLRTWSGQWNTKT